MLLNQSCLLEELEVKVVYFEAQCHVELTGLIVRASQAFLILVRYDFE